MSFLNEVCRELLEWRKAPPSDAPLSTAEQTAIQIAKSWTGLILKPPFLPPPEAAYVPSHAGADSFDILRVWYPTPLGEVLIAQTFCVFCVLLPGAPRDPNVIAKQIFQQKDRLHLKTSADEANVSYGEQPPPAEGRPWDWMDHLRWWTDGETLGFLTLKKSEAPGKAMMGWGEDLNRHWFRS